MSATVLANGSQAGATDKMAALQIKELEKQINYYQNELQKAESGSTQFEQRLNAKPSQDADELRQRNVILTNEVKMLQRQLAYQENEQSDEHVAVQSNEQALRDRILQLEQSNATYRKENEQLLQDNEKLLRVYQKSQQDPAAVTKRLCKSTELQRSISGSNHVEMEPPKSQVPLPAIEQGSSRTFGQCEKCKDLKKRLAEANQQLSLYDDAFREKKAQYLSMFEAFKKLRNQARMHISTATQQRDQAIADTISMKEQLLEAMKLERRERRETQRKISDRQNKQTDQREELAELQRENEEMREQIEHLTLEVNAFESQEKRQAQIQDLTARLRLENDAFKKNLASVEYEFENQEKLFALKALANEAELSKLQVDNNDMQERIRMLESESLKSQRIMKLEGIIQQYAEAEEAALCFANDVNVLMAHYETVAAQ